MRHVALVPPALELRAGCVEFDGVHVLDHLDLSIAAGAGTALLGANGSGKTTLVRALVGLQPLAHGQVLIHGVPAAQFRDRARLALVPQRLPAASGVPISVGEFVGLGAVTRRTWGGLGAPRGSRESVATALAEVGLAERSGSRLDTLSGGQQRRAMVARALAGPADTLILDEPTAGVDHQSQDLIAASLGRLLDRGRTLLVVTHGLGPLAPLVSRTVVLGGGRVLYDGSRPPAEYDHGVDHDRHHHETDDLRAASAPTPLLEA
ncbi:MAG: metal ABC transporter ATP-binding protein [Candidatus Nanopelagicales bacterium]